MKRISPSKVGSPRNRGYVVTNAYNGCKERIKNMNPRQRWAFLAVWLLWKVVAGCVLVYFAYEEFLPPTAQTPGIRAASLPLVKPLRVLYIVTSLAEFNTGQRKTVKNQDRLKEVMLPVLADSINSIVRKGNIQVDVFLVTAFELKPEREALIRKYLPPSVGLQVWDDACPLGYDPPLREKASLPHALSENTRALSRQHRYVIRDKLEYYDLFVAVEDDMRITGEHIQHFVETSNAIDTLRETAPAQSDASSTVLSQQQLDRIVPGFVRVEVLLNPDEFGPQTKLAPVPLDYDFPSGEAHFDPSICCHVNLTGDLIPKEAPIPPAPPRDNIVIWETTVEAMAVRQLPANSYLDWVVLLPGPGKKMKDEDRIFGYWSGNGGAFGPDAVKPSPGEPHLIAQQGGWLATRDQIHRMQELCLGRFLPPFDQPEYRSDGQESMNVEFWSGGYQFFTGVKGGCNMQRIISLKPEHFSKHFIYHAANNKQRQLSRERMLKADHFMAQLNSVRKAAEKALQT